MVGWLAVKHVVIVQEQITKVGSLLKMPLGQWIPHSFRPPSQ